MMDITFIRSLGLIIIGAALFMAMARVIRMPTIVACILAGLALGPIAGIVSTNENLELISRAGIALLLFLVGLDISLDKVRNVGRVAVVAGGLQIAVTAVGGYGVCRLLGLGSTDSLFLATALTFSSTVLVVKLLGERGELDSLHGRIAVGIFLVQDVLAILVLTLLSGFQSRGAGSATAAALMEGIAGALAGMALLTLLAVSATRYVLPRPVAWAARSPDTHFILSLTWCFLLSLLAEWMHLSMEIGAFLAGIAMAQLPFHQELHRRVHPLMNFFIAVFFVTLGTRMGFQGGVDAGAAVLLAGFVLLIKPALFVPIISRMGYSRRTSFLSGVAVAQVSEFSLIIVALGASAGMVSQSVLSTTTLVALLTFAASSYMIVNGAALYAWAERTGLLSLLAPARGAAAMENAADALRPMREGHVIVVGMNTLGREIVSRLQAQGEPVLAIDVDPAKLRDLPCETLQGSVDYLSLLFDAGLPRAKLLVSAMMDEETNDLLAHRCASFGVPSAIHAIDLSVVDNLLSANTTYLMIPKVDGIKLQTRELRRLGYLD
jgi:Kef-type K+ transport system membrane component KefB